MKVCAIVSDGILPDMQFPTIMFPPDKDLFFLLPLLLENGVSAQSLDCYKYLRVEDLMWLCFRTSGDYFHFSPTISHYIYYLISIFLIKAKGSN